MSRGKDFHLYFHLSLRTEQIVVGQARDPTGWWAWLAACRCADNSRQGAYPTVISGPLQCTPIAFFGFDRRQFGFGFFSNLVDLFLQWIAFQLNVDLLLDSSQLAALIRSDK